MGLQERANKRKIIMDKEKLIERIIKALEDMPIPEDLHISEQHSYGYALRDAIQIIKQLNK